MATNGDPKVGPDPTSIAFGRRASGVQPRVVVEDGAALTQDERARIDAAFAALATTSLYDLLGVPSDADKRDIKRAYHERAREFHPDRYFRRPLGECRRKLEAIFARMTEAHELLISPARRVEYDAVRRTNRHSLVEELLQEVAEEMAGAEEGARREQVDVDPDIRMDTTSEVPPAPRVVESPRAALARLRELHARREARMLSDDERVAYDALADDFARDFVLLHRIAIEVGETYRQALRAAVALKLQIDAAGRTEKTISVAVSAGGFAALLSAPLPAGSGCAFVLQATPTPIRGLGHVVACERYGNRGTLSRVTFAIDRLAAADRDRLDGIVVGAALAAARSWG